MWERIEVYKAPWDNEYEEWIECSFIIEAGALIIYGNDISHNSQYGLLAGEDCNSTIFYNTINCHLNPLFY